MISSPTTGTFGAAPDTSGAGRDVFWEPVENWRFFARHARQVLEMAAATYNGQVMESAITEQLFPGPPSVKGSGVAPIGPTASGQERRAGASALSVARAQEHLRALVRQHPAGRFKG